MNSSGTTNETREDEPITTELRVSESGQTATKSDRRPVLVSLSGELIATPIPLERDVVTLGRALEADIRLNDSKASRLHAQIEVTDNTLFRIKDLGSTNGTLVNGQVVKEAILKDGDKIIIGDHLFRFDLQDDIDREFQQQIHRLIGHDHLTGLLTSRSFFTELHREASRAEEQNRPFGVLMMDVDHFKEVNDKYGHLAGSLTLQEMADLIKKALRSGDVAARFGGEEFAAFLLDANYAQAIVAGERVRRSIERHVFTARDYKSDGGSATFRITISIGVAAYPDDGTDPIKLIELADSALYRAKGAGRNQVCAYRPSLASIERPMPPRQD